MFELIIIGLLSLICILLMILIYVVKIGIKWHADYLIEEANRIIEWTIQRFQ